MILSATLPPCPACDDVIDADDSTIENGGVVWHGSCWDRALEAAAEEGCDHAVAGPCPHYS